MRPIPHARARTLTRTHTHAGFTVSHSSEFALSAFQAGHIKQIVRESKLSLLFNLFFFFKGSGGQTALMARERVQCVAIERSALTYIQRRLDGEDGPFELNIEGLENAHKKKNRVVRKSRGKGSGR